MTRIDVLTSEAEIVALSPEWTALLEGVTLRTPSKTPLWSLTWLRHFGARRGPVSRHEPRVFVLRDEDGALIGVAPMLLTHRPGYGAGLFRELQFFGADPYVTQLRGPVCRRDRLADVCRALVAAVETSPEQDFVQWRGMAPGTCGDDHAARSRTAQLDDIDCWLPMRESFDAFQASLPKKTRKHLRKSANDLKAAGVAPQFRVTTAPEAVAGGLQAFYALHGRRAAQTDIVQHPNVFATAAARAFLDDYCAAMARNGDLRLFEMLVEDKVVASRIGFALGDELYLYFSGYAPEYGPYSIMTTLMAETLRWAHATGVRLVNLSSGVDRSKTRFRPEMTFAEGFYSTTGTLRGRLALPLMRRLRHGRDQILAPPQTDDGCEELAEA